MTRTEVEAAALHYAQTYGWAVHPVNLDKIPTTDHGFYDATTDEQEIRSMFANGVQVSIRTGMHSGVFILDIDQDTGGYETLAALEAKHGKLPRTPRQRTGSGGTHYLFQHFDGARNSTTAFGLGVHTRGEGGYAVVAPSRNRSGEYKWIVSPDECLLAECPQWIRDALAKDNRPQPTATPAQRDTSAYARAALADELAQLARATNGTRNSTLNRCAFSLGQLVGAGAIDQMTVETALAGVASAIGLEPREINATIRSGLTAGAKEPRRIPDRKASDRQVITTKDHSVDHTADHSVDHSPRFAIKTEQALYDLPPLTFLDRELALVAESYHLIYGASGSGKTFFTVERAMRQVAAGKRVLYIATEDLSGLRYRVAAWRKAHPDAQGRLTWLDMPRGLDLQDHKQIAELIETISPYEYDHIVLDTLREAHTGDENSSQDTARINRAVQRLVACGAAVDVVHHSGVAGQRPRGSTALFSNANVVIQVDNDDDRIRITFDKLRAPPRDPLLFGLCQQDTGMLDSDNQPVISAVIRPTAQVTQRGAKLTKNARKVLEALAMGIFSELGAKVTQLIDTTEISRRHVYLALDTLKERGYASQAAKGDPFYITPEGRSQLLPDYVPSDLGSSAPECEVISSDPDVIGSDQDTQCRDVIPSDHTRRVITGITTLITDQHSPNGTLKPIPRRPENVNARLAREREQELIEAAAAAEQFPDDES